MSALRSLSKFKGVSDKNSRMTLSEDSISAVEGLRFIESNLAIDVIK